MKALIVEDDFPKRTSIVELVREKFPDIDLDVAVSVNSAIRFIDSREYDFMILDMSLPNFDGDKDATGGRPVNYGGEDLLDYIDNLEKTTKVIFISQYAKFKEAEDETGIVELAKTMSQTYPEYYVTMIHYNTAFDNWRKELQKSIEEVISNNA